MCKKALQAARKADFEADFILIERMKENEIKIPVIICSKQKIHLPDALGRVE